MIEEKYIGGEYRHYKGKPYYVYCPAMDSEGNLLVLYRQLYGDGGLWLRPYAMFFETVEVEGETLERFKPLATKGETAARGMEELIALLACSPIPIRHSETEKAYRLTALDKAQGFAAVSLID